MKPIASFIRKIADSSAWQDKIKAKFGISCLPKEPGEPLDPIILKQTYQIFDMMPVELVKDCKVPNLYFSSTMGPSRPLWPNHGYFYPGDKTITLNNNIFLHPDVNPDFSDGKGNYLDRATQTLLHELGHALDNALGEESPKKIDLSLLPDWLKLSGWSEKPRKGLRRMVINEPGMPTKFGEYYYEPSADFTRYYGAMAPWDDWADCSSFYFGGMKSKIPAIKRVYFDKLLKNYY